MSTTQGTGAVPAAFASVKRGDWLTVKSSMWRRKGAAGMVIAAPTYEGVSLDFFTCGQCGAEKCACYTSIEFWEWGELEEP